VYDYYKRHGRDLPWRRTRDPYHILVSEIMLQQTQVARVLTKYPLFLRRFPTVQSLARAPFADIMRVWQGMGYNRRALALKKLAEALVKEHGARVPAEREALKALPGIGEATSGAICAFAFNKPEVFIETNIRSVFIHHFFKDRAGVSDAQLLPLLTRALDRKNPRIWYSALMDYGVYLKEATGNPSRRSLHYHRQDSFEGSNRQIRGKILKILLKKPALGQVALGRKLKITQKRLKPLLACLCKEGLLSCRGNSYNING